MARQAKMKQERDDFIVIATRWDIPAEDAGELWDANHPATHHVQPVPEPVCDDPFYRDVYLWHVNVNGCVLTINHDDLAILTVLAGHAGWENLDLDDVDKLHEQLGNIRTWMHAQQEDKE